ncbi:MAG: transcriptional repressor, partial [Bdellovibrionales bacterium]|nr:transcriptional repressor [Bdellovibrionales bacterium]
MQQPISWSMELMTNTDSFLPVSQDQAQLPKNDQYKDVPHKKIIRDLGLKVTQQRILILEVVRSGPSHFTAQEVFEIVGERNPDVGFATVYRFLKKLSEQNFVTEVRMGGMPARYEWAAKAH